MANKKHMGSSSRRQPGAAELDNLTSLFKQGRTAEAEILSKSLTARFPKHGFGWKVLGAVYQAQKRYEDSLHATRHAIALLPGDAATHNNLGTALLKLGRHIDAEASFRKALAIAPHYAKSLSNLGSLLTLRGKLFYFHFDNTSMIQGQLVIDLTTSGVFSIANKPITKSSSSASMLANTLL